MWMATAKVASLPTPLRAVAQLAQTVDSMAGHSVGHCKEFAVESVPQPPQVRKDRTRVPDKPSDASFAASSLQSHKWRVVVSARARRSLR